mmetsp:Transcript_59297/g.171333  ORF Transcript_59297/g.171333 Transcript_59297/m.171333 type:complete len:218 (+) Transcript_59297:373-1026(+)
MSVSSAASEVLRAGLGTLSSDWRSSSAASGEETPSSTGSLSSSSGPLVSDRLQDRCLHRLRQKHNIGTSKNMSNATMTGRALCAAAGSAGTLPAANSTAPRKVDLATTTGSASTLESAASPSPHSPATAASPVAVRSSVEAGSSGSAVSDLCPASEAIAASGRLSAPTSGSDAATGFWAPCCQAPEMLRAAVAKHTATLAGPLGAIAADWETTCGRV